MITEYLWAGNGHSSLLVLKAATDGDPGVDIVLQLTCEQKYENVVRGCAMYCVHLWRGRVSARPGCCWWGSARCWSSTRCQGIQAQESPQWASGASMGSSPLDGHHLMSFPFDFFINYWLPIWLLSSLNMHTLLSSSEIENCLLSPLHPLHASNPDYY